VSGQDEQTGFKAIPLVVILPALSLGSYLFAYSFQVGYLSHFGFSRAFVEVGLKGALLSLVGGLAVSTSIWIIVSGLPIALLRNLALLSFILVIPAVVSLITYWVFVRTGYSWVFIDLSLLAVLSYYAFVIPALCDVKNRKSLSEIVGRIIDDDRPVRPHFVGTRFFDSLPSSYGAVFVALLVLGPLGTIVGDRFAARSNGYNVTNSSPKWLVVDAFGSGFLLAEFTYDGLKLSKATLSGNTMYASASDDLMDVMQFDTSIRVTKAEETSRGTQRDQYDRVYFDEFIDRLTWPFRSISRWWAATEEVPSD
jgi:hypothetical protein